MILEVSQQVRDTPLDSPSASNPCQKELKELALRVTLSERMLQRNGTRKTVGL
jgi:hypothetical protein